MKASQLHRLHLAASASRVEFRHNGSDCTWRMDGGNASLPLKRAMAERIATCWNVLEGIPTAALLDGVLRDIFMAIDAGDLAEAQRLLAVLDSRTDLTDGRAHDCKQCLGEDP